MHFFSIQTKWIGIIWRIVLRFTTYISYHKCMRGREKESETRKHIPICSDFIKSQYIELISLLCLSWWVLFRWGACFHLFLLFTNNYRFFLLCHVLILVPSIWFDIINMCMHLNSNSRAWLSVNLILVDRNRFPIFQLLFRLH